MNDTIDTDVLRIRRWYRAMSPYSLTLLGLILTFYATWKCHLDGSWQYHRETSSKVPSYHDNIMKFHPGHSVFDSVLKVLFTESQHKRVSFQVANIILIFHNNYGICFKVITHYYSRSSL